MESDVVDPWGFNTDGAIETTQPHNEDQHFTLKSGFVSNTDPFDTQVTQTVDSLQTGSYTFTAWIKVASAADTVTTLNLKFPRSRGQRDYAAIRAVADRNSNSMGLR